MSEYNFVLAISGASGALYASCLIRSLARLISGKSSLIISPSALRVYREESNSNVDKPENYLEQNLKDIPSSSRKHEFVIEDYHNIGASCASGSHFTNGMIILPCSMKTIAGIAHGYTSNLIERAADVCIKERRKLIVVPRETPYSQIHLENMLRLTEVGGVVLPASPGFYQKPKSIEELAFFITGRILSQFQIKHDLFKAWTGKA